MVRNSGTRSISVIIPTYNRSDYLEYSLSSLLHQSLPQDQFEVVVVDDGSEDETPQLCRRFQSRLPLKYFRQEHSGTSAAKNLGVFASESRVVLFFDDDDCAHKDLLLNHLKMHQRWPGEETAVLGHTTWFPGIPVTPVMHYITEVGCFLCSYVSLRDGQVLDFTYFWGGRTSCKRSLLIRNGIFNPDFRTIEDIELGYRLSKFNLKVVYSQACVSYMKRSLTFEQFCNRCERNGQSQYLFSSLHPAALIQQYCLADQARHQWQYIRENLDRWFSRVKELEALLMSGAFRAGKSAFREELYSLYRRTFIGSKIKGFIDAERSSEKKTALHDSDFLYYEQKRAASRQSEIRPIEGVSAFQETERIPVGIATPGIKVLVAHPTPPLYDRASGDFRLYNLVRILREQGHHVTYVCLYGKLFDDIDMSPYISALSGMGVLVHALDTPSRQLSCCPTPAATEAFADLLRENEYDVALLAFFNFAGGFIPTLRSISPRTKIVIDTVDIHFLRERREAELSWDPAAMKLTELTKADELGVYSHADALITVTEQDWQHIDAYLPAKPHFVIPNVHFVPDSPGCSPSRSGLLFIGGFKHRPNTDAVLYFIKEIFPLVKKAAPDITMEVVGSSPPDRIRELRDEGVTVTGYVPYTEPYLQKARVSIAPLRYGSGMKGKIGEAMAHGVPVVTTSVGAEGIGLVHGKTAFIADTPAEFAQHVVNLYSDDGLWSTMSENARLFIKNNYSPQAVSSAVHDMMSRLAQLESHRADLSTSTTRLSTFSALNIGWDNYDDAYQVWKQYKRENAKRRHQTLKTIGYQYGVCLFFLLYPIYKTVKPFIKITKTLLRRKTNRSLVL